MIYEAKNSVYQEISEMERRLEVRIDQEIAKREEKIHYERKEQKVEEMKPNKRKTKILVTLLSERKAFHRK